MLITTQILDSKIAHEGLSKFEGQTVLCEVVKWHPRRSIQSNRYYWAVLNEVIRQTAEYTGHTKDELHEAFKDMFLKSNFVNVLTGESGERAKSTTKLNSAEFSEYVEKVKLYCIENFKVEI